MAYKTEVSVGVEVKGAAKAKKELELIKKAARNLADNKNISIETLSQKQPTERQQKIFDMARQMRATDALKSSAAGAGGSALKIGAALMGFRTAFSILRKIGANNQYLTQAVKNITSSISQVLEPVLNFLAKLLNTLAVWISGIFGSSKKTAVATAATARQLAGFDELNNLTTGSGSGASSVNVGTLDWLFDILNGLKEIIVGIIEVVKASILGIPAFIGVAIVVIADAVMCAVVNLGGFSGGIIAGIGTFVSTLFKEFPNGFKQAFSKAWDAAKAKFKEVFDTCYNWYVKTIRDPLMKSLEEVWNNIKPILQKIIDGFCKIVNGIISMLNTAIKYLNLIPGVNIGRIGSVTAPKLANGGMVNSGQLFIANEKGPELITTYGSKTAVTNNDQIVEAIKNGVIEAMQQSRQAINIQVDGKTLASVVASNTRKNNRIMGGSY